MHVNPWKRTEQLGFETITCDQILRSFSQATLPCPTQRSSTMADLADVPDVLGTLTTLNRQVHEAREKLIAAREEVETLREELIISRTESEQSQETIDAWKTRWRKDGQAQREVIWKLVKRYKTGRDPVSILPADAMTSPNSTFAALKKGGADLLPQNIDRMQKQYAGGFVKLKTVMVPEFSPAEEARRAGKGVTLRSMASQVSPPSVKPENLTYRDWKLTTFTLGQKRIQTDLTNAELAEKARDQEDKISPTSPVPEGRHDSPHEDSSDSRYLDDATPEGEARCVKCRKFITRSNTARHRSLCRNEHDLPADTSTSHRIDSRKRRRSDSRAEGHALDLAGSRRTSSASGTTTSDAKKPRTEAQGDAQPILRRTVCVRCYDDVARCDGNAQCARCLNTGLHRVHKLCERGASCFKSRCPCLHPGEYDERDREWVVEPGPMAKRQDPVVRRREGDFYRPGQEDRAQRAERPAEGERGRGNL